MVGGGRMEFQVLTKLVLSTVNYVSQIRSVEETRVPTKILIFLKSDPIRYIYVYKYKLYSQFTLLLS